MSRRSSPPILVHLHHLNCVLLDPGSGCASPLSIDSVVFWCCYLVDFKVLNGPSCYGTSIFISFLDYWQVTLIWSPHGDASLIRCYVTAGTFTQHGLSSTAK